MNGGNNVAIDWNATGSMISGIGTLIGATAVLGAVWVGRATLETWKAQKIKDRRMEAAKCILTLAYRIRSAFTSVRGRGVLEYETKAAEEKLYDNLPDWRSKEVNQQRRMTEGQVILNRLHSHEDDWQEILVQKPLALALFGTDVENDLHSFWSHYVAVEIAASSYGEDGMENQSERALRRDIFGGTDDELDTDVEAAIASLETRLLPILSATA